MKHTTVRHAIFLLSVFMSSAVFAQAPEKNIRTAGQLWFGYLNQMRFSKKWGAWLDIHYRMTDNLADRPMAFLFRPGATYFIKDNLRINVGYTLVKHYPRKGFNTTRTEHRPWQQIWWNQKYPGLVMLQHLRFEQRFNQKVVSDQIEDGYNYTFRIRYGLSFFVPLKGKEIVAKSPFIAFTNEVFLNFGDRIIYNTFDQNRLFIGLGYQFTPHINVQGGYMNLYQQEASGYNYLLAHVVRLSLFQTLDFRKKE
jgi:Protein of unknown function (DUF2490)